LGHTSEKICAEVSRGEGRQGHGKYIYLQDDVKKLHYLFVTTEYYCYVKKKRKEKKDGIEMCISCHRM